MKHAKPQIFPFEDFSSAIWLKEDYFHLRPADGPHTTHLAARVDKEDRVEPGAARHARHNRVRIVAERGIHEARIRVE